MEHGAHDVVHVASQDADAGATLPVPDADRLVIRCGHDQRVLVVEESGANIIQVAE